MKENIDKETEEIQEIEKELKPKKEEPIVVKSKIGMTIEKTKIGVTLVLSKEDCKILGFYKDASTKRVIEWTREKLGLPKKERKGRVVDKEDD